MCSLKDYLGNVRVSFTTVLEESESLATLESARENEESEQFLYLEEAVKINAMLFDHTNTGTTHYSTRLNGTEQERYGLAKSLSVMPGDTVRAEVFVKYLDSNSSNWTQALTDFMNAIATGTAPAGTIVDGGLPGSTGGQIPYFTGLLDKQEETGSVPKAYLNYLLVDSDFQFVDGGYVRLSEQAREYGQNGVHERLAAEMIITQPGYVYIYLSNDNVALGGPMIEVYFDDFKVSQVQSPILQETFYYPFGAVASSYQRENSLPNRHLYQGKEWQDDLGLSSYDFEWRQYDPWEMVTTTLDPHAEKYYSMSPYSWVLGNPMIMVDPDGRDGVFFLHVLYNENSQKSKNIVEEAVKFALSKLSETGADVSVVVKFASKNEKAMSKDEFFNRKGATENDKYILFGSTEQLTQFDNDNENGWSRHGGEGKKNWATVNGTANETDPISYINTDNIFRFYPGEQTYHNNLIHRKVGTATLHEPGHQLFKDHPNRDYRGHVEGTVLATSGSSNVANFDEWMVNVLKNVYGVKNTD
jgi:RHS repeat-associated protein